MKYLPVTLFAFLFLALAYCLSSLLPYPSKRISMAVSYPYQLDAEEGFILDQAFRLSKGVMLYKPIDRPPYVVDNYPPLLPVLWSLFLDKNHPSLAPGRWIVAISGWIAALAIFFLVLQSARGLPFFLACLIAVPPPLLLMTSYEFLRWVGYGRVDMPALAFSMVGLAIFHGASPAVDLHKWRRPAAAVLFLLALLSKQTAVLAPAACFFYLCLRRDFRGALFFFAWMAAGMLVSYGGLTAVTAGGFWKHLVTYNKNVMHWNEIFGVWVPHLFRLYHFLWAAALLLAGWTVWRWLAEEKSPKDAGGPEVEGRSSAPVLLLFYFVLTLLSVASVAKAGSAENYLLEPLAGLALLLGAGLASVTRAALDKSAPAWGRGMAALIALLSTALIGCHTAFFAFSMEPVIFYSAPSPSMEALSAGNKVMKLVRATKGAVLSEDPIYGLLAGRQPVFQNFIMTQLTREGKWDETPFIQRVLNREFELVVAHTDIRQENQFFSRYSPALRRALSEKYQLLDELRRPPPLQTIYLFIPKFDSGN